MLLQLVCFLVVALLHFLYYKSRKADRMLKGVKLFPGSTPLFGLTFRTILVAFNGTKGVRDFFNGMICFEEDFRTSVIGKQLFVAVEPDTLNAILSSPHAIKKPFQYKFFEYGNRGLLCSSGAKWKQLRPKLNKLLNSKYFEEYLNSVNNNTNIFIQLMNETEGKTVDIEEYLIRFSWDISSEIFYGVDENVQRDKGVTVANISERLASLAFLRLFAFWLYTNFTYKLSAMKRYINKLGHNCFEQTKELMRRSLEIYEKRKEAVQKEFSCRKPYSVIYKELYETNYSLKCSLEELTLGASDVLIAASHTPAVVTSTVLYFLAAYPEYQEKVYDEVMELYSGGDWSKQQLSRMVYLDMVIHDSLRYCSPFIIARYSLEDIDIGKCIIPKGTAIFCMLRNNQMSEKYIKDPKKFNPDNFLPERVKERPKNVFIPFAAGPRECPGKALSWFYCKCVVAETVRHFRISTSLDPKDIQYDYGLMTEFMGGYPLAFTPRKGRA